VSKSFPVVKYFQNTTNLGFPKALNIGLRQSSGDFIVILNPDTILPRNFFTQSLTFFFQHPDAKLMGPRLLDANGEVQGSVFPEPSIISTFLEFWLGKTGLTSKYSPDTNSPLQVNSVSGSCMVMPRLTVKQIGLFTEKVFIYFEDLDYCRRIRARGGKIYFNPAIQIIHEHGSSAKQSLKASPDKNPFWKGYLWESSLWYNGPIKHYLMTFISWTGQKWHNMTSK
jgi:GT2 family glycosyltransferase